MQTSSAGRGEPKTVEARCTGGKVVVGGGARILGATTDNAPAGVVIVASYPVGLNDTPSPIWKATAMELQVVDADWRLSTHVVCADAD